MKQCKVVRNGAAFHGKQGLDYFAGISAESAGAEGICMHLLVVPPGGEAKPHYHANHETAIAQQLLTEFVGADPQIGAP